MAMYKVPVRVYETPSGKTLWVPTYMRMLSWFVMMPAAACIWVTIEFIFGGDRKDVPILLLLSVAFAAVVILLRRGAKALAVRAYMKELEQMMLQEAGHAEQVTIGWVFFGVLALFFLLLLWAMTKLVKKPKAGPEATIAGCAKQNGLYEDEAQEFHR